MSDFRQDIYGTSQQPQRVKVVAGYSLQQRLGSGSFATVYKGVKVPESSESDSQQQQQEEEQQQHPHHERRQTDDSGSSLASEPDVVAIKAIARTSEKLTKKVLQNLEIEISILRTYRHPNIVCMHNVQKTDRHFYLILEYCGGGDVQRLIRTRKSGRLTERLARRLMRDLSAGLKFLWGQELIHRDIKPQNLLLTGCLPLDEVNDPDATPEEEARRKQINFPSSMFSLKIADFGFARHLQTASLAETLCGSPLYMAPEILQHHRYDAKADIWSVGTVLFEMIAGRPPFNGENHIDLLRNIQRKAVRLPPDVRVSKACVNLLRLLLNRNPLSRAGFKEFFEACDVLVALGCEGVETKDSGSCRIPSNDLGTIPENDGPSTSPPTSSDSLMTVATAAGQQGTTGTAATQPNPPPPPPSTDQPSSVHPLQGLEQQLHPPNANIVSPPLTPAPSPVALIPSANLYDSRPYQPPVRTRLSPLTQSPPSSGAMYYHHHTRLLPAPLPTLGATTLEQNQPASSWPQQQVPAGAMVPSSGQLVHSNSVSQSQTSAGDDSGFVMVERMVGSSRNDLYEQPNNNMTTSSSGTRRTSPATSQPFYVTAPPPAMGVRTDDNNVLEERARLSKGMCGTSPGTGQTLLEVVGRAPIGFTNIAPNDNSKLGDDIEAANKLVATAEDVGRRAVSVAHLGDTRAYLGMRLVFKNEEGSSLLSVTPMEGVEEEPGDDPVDGTDDSGSTEIMGPARRRSSTMSDKQMTEACHEEDQGDEMPFAISPEAPAVSLPSRSNLSFYNRGAASASSIRKGKSDPQTIQAHFAEALSCYLKALHMLKGAVGAAQRVTNDLERLQTQVGRSPTDYDVPKLKKRCELTSTWLLAQFRGVLERADAAKVETSKLASSFANFRVSDITPINVTSVEELIYNHALASGRDGAVKHLLGQYDAARSCYRSAGLLAETLLMEVNVGAEDRKILEGYVDGFAARITELDHLMMQQSRMVGSSNISTSRRGSGVVGLIGPPPAAPTGFLGGSPR